jgi:hypothetical protein
VTESEATPSGYGYITGIFQTSMDENAQIKTSNAYGKGNGNTVIIHFTGVTPSQSGVFYVPVPTGTYSTVTIKLVDNADNPTKTYAYVQRSNVTVDRGMLYGIILDETSVSEDGDAILSITVSTVDEANAALAAADNVEVTLTYLNLDGTFYIPAVETREGSKKKLTISAVSEEFYCINVNDASSDSQKSVENLTIVLPSTNDEEHSINMPNTTVSIESTSGATSIGRILSTTADNTLIVGNGVTIGALSVLAGNVIVKNGATVKAIYKHSSNTSDEVYVTVEDGGTVSTYGENVYDVSNITTYNVLNNALTYEGELSLKLGSDVELTNGIYIQGTKTLDLNGHTIKPSSTFMTSGMLCVASTATLTINDSVGGGTITANGNDVVRNVIAVDSGGTLIENYEK